MLILEDSRSDAALMVDALRRAGFDPKWERVEDEPAFAARLAPELDLILSDYNLPTYSGLQAIRLVRSRGLDIPFILVSGSIGEDYAVEAMRAGADDYLLKDRMARLGPAIHTALERRRLRDAKERAEASRGTSEVLYRSIFEGAAEGILLSTLEGYLLAANPAAAQILGYDSPEELVSSVTNPGHRLYAEPDARRALFERVKLDGEVHGYETRGLRKDGTPLWVSLSARLVGGDRGGTSHVLTMIADISERRRADEARAHLAAIVENSNDAIIGRSLDGAITSWNAGAERMLGYTASEALGRQVSFLIPPGQRVRSAELSEKILRGEAIAPHVTRRLTKDRRVIDVMSSISPLRDSDGNVVGSSHILHDITALKQAEEALRSSEETLSAMFEQAGVGMGLRSLEPRNPRWLRVNQKLCNIFGYSEEELLQLTTVDLTPPEERGLAIAYNEKLRKGEITSYSREKRYLRKDGRIIWANISLTALRDPDGRPTHVISVIEDITSRKESEEKVRRLSRVRVVLSEINAAIVRSRSKQMLFYEACGIAIEHGGFGIAWVGTYDPENMEVTPVASAGLGESTSLMHEKLVVRGDTAQARGIIARAIRERRPVFDNDITVDPAAGGKRRQEAIRRGYRSVIALPLVVDRVVAGIFSMFAKEAGFFDREEVSLLSELAGNISIALERMATQEKLGKLSRIRALSSEINAAIVRIRERDALLAETCRIASEHGGIEMTWVGAIDSEKQEVQPVAWRGFSAESAHAVSWASINAAKGTLGEAMHTRRAAVRDDIETQLPAGKLRQQALAKGCHSTVCLPLVVEGRVAALAALFAPGRGFFDESELALLNELAGNISFALEHISRQERIEKLSRIRAVSSEINAAIARVREREALLRETCRVASEHGKFEFVWVASVDPERQRIQPVAWTGFAPETAQSVNWASIGVPGVTLGEVIRTRRLAVRNDFDAERPTGILRQEAAKKGFRSTVCLPFLVDGKVAAAMILFATGRNFFVEDELALLGEVASNISFTLEAIAQQERIERLTRIRTVLGEINAAIVRIRKRQELFEEACRITVEHGKFGMAWISEFDPLTLDVTPIAYAGAAAGDFVTSKTTARADVPLGQGVVGRAIRARDLVFVNDMTAEPDVGSTKRREAIRLGYRSVIALPLMLQDAVFGTLTLYAKEPDFFNEDELRLLRELTGDISFALENIAKEEKLSYLAYYDTLTALPNRTLFIDRANQQMQARSGEAPIVAMILINLERFRNINESFGRHGGDELLKLVAKRLEKAFHGKDYLARTGADGFGVVIRGIRDAETVVHILGDEVLGCFREPYHLSGSEVRVAAKAAIAMFPADGSDADTLFNNAEAALKKARETGERYLFYATDMNARAAQVLSLETRLRNAVEKQQFVLHYQPKFNLVSDTVCGLEALIRWDDPESGLVAPGMFIPLLEETGLILEVGRWAIAQALIDHRGWTARGCTVPRIAVNVSAIQLQQRDFTETVINAVQQAGGGVEALEIEITESLLMKDIEASIRKLSILRGLGIHIAMDDFGTGYSSLSYIARLPINLIKIDRAFINGIAMNPQDMGIVTTIIALAHSLNLRVVAEGVETREQSQLLKLLKCDEAQGYLFSKPVPPGQIEPVLRAKVQVAP